MRDFGDHLGGDTRPDPGGDIVGRDVDRTERAGSDGAIDRWSHPLVAATTADERTTPEPGTAVATLDSAPATPATLDSTPATPTASAAVDLPYAGQAPAERGKGKAKGKDKPAAHGQPGHVHNDECHGLLDHTTEAFERVGWVAFLLVAIVTALITGHAPNPAQKSALLVICAGGVSVVALIAAALPHRRRRPLPWAVGQPEPFVLLGASLGVLVLGDIARIAIDHAWLAPIPGTGDILTLAAYPFAGAAFLTMIKDRVPGRSLDSLFNAAIAAAAAGFLCWVLAVSVVSADIVSPVKALAAIIFPALDLLILCLLVRLMLLTQDTRAAYRYLVLGWVSLLILHAARAASVIGGTEPSITKLGAAAVLAYGLWGTAALHPSTVELVEPVVMPPARLSAYQIGLMAVAVMLGPIVLAWDAGDNARVPVIVAGSAVLSLLVVAHLVRLVQGRAAIEHRAHHDELTGLPNRTLFYDRVAVALAHARRSGGKVALMFLDLDRFKTVNDSLGHAVGNQLLQGVAKRLHTCVRAEDTVARLGGDEFTILLPVVGGSDDAAAVAQKILDAFGEPFNAGKKKLHVSPSIGIAIYPTDGDDPESLLKNADTAMYRAKEQGRKTYRIYNRTMNARAHEKLELENSLHTAIEHGELVLHYQPKVDLRSGKVVGMEALVRWDHPTHGLLHPGDFITLAEESGLIVPLGEWVLEEACRQNKAWQDAGFPSLRVAVNLSARQFQQQKVEDMTARVLRSTGMDANFLEYEVTESLALQDPDQISRTLHDLKEMGVACAIDDFGTGYSGLSYLTRYPIDALKIDKSFVGAIGDRGGEAPIVVAVIALAHSLNMEVIAEGVETQEQLEFLRSLGCDTMQGYLFSAPLPADRFENLLMLELVVPGPGRLPDEPSRGILAAGLNLPSVAPANRPVAPVASTPVPVPGARPDQPQPLRRPDAAGPGLLLPGHRP